MSAEPSSSATPSPAARAAAWRSSWPAHRCCCGRPARCGWPPSGRWWSPTCTWRRARPTPRAASCCRPTTPARRWPAWPPRPPAASGAIVLLGDSFHDGGAEERLDADAPPPAPSPRSRAGLGRRQPRRRRAARLPGETAAAWRAAGLRSSTSRRRPALGEVAGHLHPCARVKGRGGSVRRRCFVTDGERMVLPAFGAYAGGLNVRDAPFAACFAARRWRSPSAIAGRTRWLGPARGGLGSASARCSLSARLRRLERETPRLVALRQEIRVALVHLCIKRDVVDLQEDHRRGEGHAYCSRQRKGWFWDETFPQCADGLSDPIGIVAGLWPERALLQASRGHEGPQRRPKLGDQVLMDRQNVGDREVVRSLRQLLVGVTRSESVTGSGRPT